MLPEVALPSLRPARPQEPALRAEPVARAAPLRDPGEDRAFSVRLERRPSTGQRRDDRTPSENMTPADPRNAPAEAAAEKPTGPPHSGVGGGLVLPTALFVDELTAEETADEATGGEATTDTPPVCCDLPPPQPSLPAAAPIALPQPAGAPVLTAESSAPGTPAVPPETASPSVEIATHAPAHQPAAGSIPADKARPEPSAPAGQADALLRPPTAETPPPPPVLPPTPAAPPAAPLGPAIAQAAPLPLAAVPMAIAAQAIAGEQRFEIRLDPAELGRVEVTLAIDREHGVRTHLVVERPETLHLLRNDLSRLEQALTDTGLKSDPGSISFSLQQGGEGGHPPGAQPWQMAGTPTSEDPDVPHAPAPPRMLRGLGSGVDLIL